MINNKGKVVNEVIVVLLMCLILSSFFLVLIFKRVKEQRFRTLSNNLILMTNSSSLYQLENDKKVIALKELIDQEIITEIRNPFDERESCDFYESRIEINGDIKQSTLKCGDFLITKKSNGVKSVIYKVGKWKETGTNNSNVMIGYNYISDEKLMLDHYYEDYMFLYLFNKHNNTSYDDISLIPENYSIVNKVFYRTRTKIKEI